MNPKEYRSHLYRVRTHPLVPPQSDFYDQRDSFSKVYLSLIPFLMAEYVAEISYELIPSGLVFPTGFLLFWAFYYTYYKPGFLEEQLSTPQKWDLVGIPTVLVGVVIWFVKVTVVELSHFFVRTLFGVPKLKRNQAPPRQAPRPKAAPHNHQQQYRSQEPPPQQPRAPAPPPLGLPRDVVTALAVLGLKEGTDWNQIHRRYRELAKQYHPDLNREITDVGRRFMMYDAAYRKLSAVKVRYFAEVHSKSAK